MMVFLLLIRRAHLFSWSADSHTCNIADTFSRYRFGPRGGSSGWMRNQKRELPYFTLRRVGWVVEFERTKMW